MSDERVATSEPVLPAVAPDAPPAAPVGTEATLPRDTDAAGWRRWLPRALFEAGLIVLSVLLAFAVDEWRQTRARRERASHALAAIRAELDSNRVLVQRARVHHRAVADTVARYVAAGAPVPQRVYFGGMFNPAYVLGVAWQSARDGGTLGELPYPLVLRLSRVYERQAQYRVLTEALLHGIYGDLMARGVTASFRDNAPSWSILLRDFADREGTLEEHYDSVLVHVRAARAQ